ncbi:hypothetical protein Hanom_Chr07g00590801 [Helianthus anomalus]
MEPRGLVAVLVVESVTSCVWRLWSSEQRNLIGSTSLSGSARLAISWEWELSGRCLVQANWLQPLLSILFVLVLDFVGLGAPLRGLCAQSNVHYVLFCQIWRCSL